MVKYVLSPHAEEKVQRRQIPLELLESVLSNPEQIVEEKQGREAYQSRVDLGGKQYLVRVVVEGVDPVIVVTGYKADKVRKYWRQP